MGVLCHLEYLQEEPTFPVLCTLFTGLGFLACAGKVFLEDPQLWAQLVPDAGPCDTFSQVLLALSPTQTPWDDTLCPPTIPPTPVHNMSLKSSTLGDYLMGHVSRPISI